MSVSGKQLFDTQVRPLPSIVWKLVKYRDDFTKELRRWDELWVWLRLPMLVSLINSVIILILFWYDVLIYIPPMRTFWIGPVHAVTNVLKWGSDGQNGCSIWICLNLNFEVWHMYIVRCFQFGKWFEVDYMPWWIGVCHLVSTFLVPQFNVIWICHF